MFKPLLTLGALSFMSYSFASEPTTLRAGVVLDANQQTAVVMLPGGGIAAVDLQSGTANWTSAASDKPLAIVDGRLLSQKQSNQSGALSLVYHNIEDGHALNTVSVELPENVMATVAHGAGHKFNIEKATNNQLQWTFTGGKAQGIAPTSATLDSNFLQAQPDNNLQSGSINIDFSSFSASSNEDATYEANVAQIEQDLLPNKPGRQFLSQDGNHVLISERIKSDKAINYRWTVYSKSGELLGTSVSAISYAPFVIAGELLIFIEPPKGQIVNGELVRNPPKLKSVNLRTKQPTWEHPIRAIKYFGPLPV